jgi:large subunit ribosomal protein L9
MAKQQLLLLQDVEALGRKGDVVFAKPGYIRNYLIPRGFAIVASEHTLRKRETLRKEREKQAIVDRAEAESLAKKLEGVILEIKVKVDPEGRMYGSVSAVDVERLFGEKGFVVEKRYIQLSRPIKETGVHALSLKLKEGIPVTCQLTILPEGISTMGQEAVVAPLPLEKESEKPE